MIVSPKKRKRKQLEKLIPRFKKASKFEDVNLCDEAQFSVELQKEKSRIDRRSVNSEFSVLLVNGIAEKTLRNNPDLLLKICERTRITDSLGWCGGQFAILLPETGRKGAESFAGGVDQIAASFEISVEMDVLVYPDDDDIARNSIEYQEFQFAEKSELEFENLSDEGDDQVSLCKIPDNVRKTFFRSTKPTPIWKRAIDVVGSSLGLMALTPVFAVAAAAIKLTDKGPIFFCQEREGKDGKTFKMYKFRTMCNNAESMKEGLSEFSEQDGPAFKLENDPRLTRVGKYLRKSCVDELPQLYNVLRGDMSLVGPRPLPVSESIECLIWQRKRLEVVPGLTCIWQVRGDRQTKFVEWMRMDMEYINNRTLGLDLKLIFQTIWVAVLHRGSV